MPTIKDNAPNLLAAFRLLSRTSVAIGVPSDDEQPHYGAGAIGSNKRADATGRRALTNAELAYIHSNGAPEINLPARPFLSPGLDTAMDRINQRLRDAANAALDGRVDGVEANFDAIGLIGQSAVKNYIAQGIPPPLKDATVRARQRRSKGSSYRRIASTAADATPLIDTAQLLNSISYVKRYGR